MAKDFIFFFKGITFWEYLPFLIGKFLSVSASKMPNWFANRKLTIVFALFGSPACHQRIKSMIYLQSSRNVHSPNETNSLTVISFTFSFNFSFLFNFFFPPFTFIFFLSGNFSLLWMILQKKKFSLLCCVDKFQNIKNITTNLTTVWVCVCLFVYKYGVSFLWWVNCDFSTWLLDQNMSLFHPRVQFHWFVIIERVLTNTFVVHRAQYTTVQYCVIRM